MSEVSERANERTDERVAQYSMRLFLNHLAHRRYRFWRNQAKEEDEGEEIPIFDEVDITFFSYLMREIADDCPGSVQLQSH